MLPFTRRRLNVLWALSALATAHHAQAAEAEPPAWPQQALEPVIVTGGTAARRLADAPYAANVVDQGALHSAGAMVNLSEALVRVPGLVVNQRQNYAQDLQISARGFGARAGFGVRGLRLYADGIPASMPDGQGQVAHFDLAGAERVEVLRGPYSALYGNSSGGVLAVFSAPVNDRQAELGLDVGSDGLRQQRLAWQAPLGSGWDMSASLTHLGVDGLRPQSGADRQLGHLRLSWQGEHDRWVWRIDNQDLQAQDPLGLSEADFQADPRQTASAATQYNTRKTVRQTQTGLSWTHDYAKAEAAGAGALAQSVLKGYWGSRGVSQTLAITPATQANARHGGGVVDFDRNYQGLDGRLVWRWTGIELLTGLNLEDQQDERRGYLNYVGSGASQQLGVTGALRRDERNTAQTREAYGQLQWQLAPAWSATAGLRTGRLSLRTEDHYLSNGNDSGRLSYHYNTPVLGLRWALSPNWSLHASAARGYESPTLGELAYTAGGSAAGFNTALQAQTSRQFELGSKWRAGRAWSVDTALFWIATANEIGVQTNAGGRSSFQNVGRTRRYGGELSAQWRINPQWRAQTSLSWLSARYRDDFLTCSSSPPCNAPTVPVAAGARIAGTQAFGAWSEISWSPQQDSEGAVEWRALGRSAANDNNSVFAPGYAIMALRWLQRWHVGTGSQIEALTRVDNLFDHRYAGSVIVNDSNGRYFEPAAERTLQLSLRYRQGF